MPTFLEARNTIIDAVSRLGNEKILLLNAVGRILSEEIYAPYDLPLWDNSAMDGYAVRTEDCISPATLNISGYMPAGGTSVTRIEPGCAVKIMTGAPIPPGADAVVPFEETEEGNLAVIIHSPVEKGQHIRFCGEDVRKGDKTISAGTILGPPEISMLASFDKASVQVFKKVLVAILSTGDELVEMGMEPKAGQIINSNTPALAAAVIEAGGEPLILDIARDTRESHRELISAGLKADALITTAGVSAGDRDLVRDILEELGVRQLFWKVDIKPGRPTAFGIKDGKPVFSLPGNPVSAMVTFEEFVRPALLKMMGHRKVLRPLVTVTLGEEIRKKPGRLHFLRVSLEKTKGGYVARSSGDQSTGILKTMVCADALALLPPDKSFFAAGETVEVHILNRQFDMQER